MDSKPKHNINQLNSTFTKNLTHNINSKSIPIPENTNKFHNTQINKKNDITSKISSIKNRQKILSSNNSHNTYIKKNNSSKISNKNNNNNNNKNYNSVNLNQSKNNNQNTISSNNIPELSIIETYGNSPHARFGHSLVKLSQVKFCLFGGALGETRKLIYSNDTYIYNILTRIWTKVITNSNLPKERAAHAAACDNNYNMMIYGGSTSNGGLADNQVWVLSLDKNNNKKGEWKLYPTIGSNPGQRYGHSLSFIKPYFILFGGNVNPNLSNDVWVIDIKNINNNNISWKKINFENDVGPSARLYHTCSIFEENKMMIFGGRDSNENPLNDIWRLSFENNNFLWERFITKDEMIPRYNHSMVLLNDIIIIIGGRSHHYTSPIPIEVYNISTNDVYKFNGISMNRQVNFLYEFNIFIFGGFHEKNQIQPSENLLSLSLNKIFENTPLINKINKNNNDNKKKILSNENKKLQFKLSPDIVIGSGGVFQESEVKENNDDPSLYHKISIDKLPEENKRIGETQNKNITDLLQNKRKFNRDLIEKFIQNLLKPFDWFNDKIMNDIHNKLPFTYEEIINLINEVKPIIEKDKSLIKIRSPCKIFGNIYGVYNDLMRYFESFGNPSDDNQMGDITFMQYIFLGDFVDRGIYSLEVVLLLFALKVKYPDFIYLIRGHHEDININEIYGLGEECKERLNDNIKDNNSIFKNINNVFDCLPFGVLIDNNILLIHGGIGASINNISDIEKIKRPLSIIHDVENIQQLNIIDLLWSEYSDDVLDVDINFERDEFKKGFVVKYGSKRLNKFLAENGINLLITAHQFIKEGFTTFNGDKLLSLFSASNYMDKYGNMGAMITIAKKNAKKRMNIIPKLINIYDTKKLSFRKGLNHSPIKGLNN